MGDRNNPIKFGPEWLRNLSCDPTSPGAQPATGRDATPSGMEPPGLGRSAIPHRSINDNYNTANSPKILLAKLRYGREEMLALYDQGIAEAPFQLKRIEMLYKPRGKPPFALSTFDDDNRDNSRQPSVTSSVERYAGAGRSRATLHLNDNRGRGLQPGETRGRPRGYNRQTSAGRGWHGNQRNTYSGMPDDDPNQPMRSWNSNSQGSGLRPNNGEQPEWQNKPQQYRVKRQTSTNWRQQQGRDEGEEWRSPDGSRRPQEKWVEWGWQQESTGRPNQDKQWHSNRRTWGGGEAGEDPLPEWAVENAEACGGTFDSSGAFHGYSNDDSNLPKNQEAFYPLTRSHTHGNFVRSKTAEEGSEEWWASEKAKKLSAKRFDASDIHFKKPSTPGKDEKYNTNATASAGSGSNGHSTHSTGAIRKNIYRTASSDRSYKNQSAQKFGSKDEDEGSPENKSPVTVGSESEENKQLKKQAEDISKEKIRLDTNEKPKEEKGNFQSVILTSNNTLRQKHQNISVTPTESPKRHPNIMQYLEPTNQSRPYESDDESRKEKENNKIVEDILQMSLDDGIPSATMNQLLTNHSSSAMNSLAQLPNPSMQMRRASPLQMLGISSQNMQNMAPSPNMQSTGVKSMMQPIGITNSMLNASLGLPMPKTSTGMPLQGIPNPGLQNPNALASGLQAMSGGNMEPSGIQPGNMHTGGPTSGLQVGGLHMSGLQGNGIQPGGNLQNNMPTGGMPNSSMQGGVPRLPEFQSPNATLPGMGNNSLFNNPMQHGNNLPNHGGDNASSLHRLQQLGSQSFNNFMYGNMMSQPPPPINNMGLPHVSLSQWYYEDPNKTIQGPFSAKEMFNWYRAGFFSPTLMVRRECEAVMRPLGTYGIMPFGHVDTLSAYPMGAGYDLCPQPTHDNMMNPQQGLGIDVPTSSGHPLRQPPYIESPNMPYDPRNPNQVQIPVAVESVGPRPDLLPPVPQPLPMPPFQLVQNNEVESLWGQPSNNAAPDLMWMQAMNRNPRNENRINNLPMYFWDNQPTDMPANPLLPEAMKTEDEILAQMRAGQPQGSSSPLSFLADPQDSDFNAATAALHLDQLQKLIQKEDSTPLPIPDVVDNEPQKANIAVKNEENASDLPTEKTNKPAEIKPIKEVAKVENGKSKSKDNTVKSKNKNKTKEEKKEAITETKTKEEDDPKEKRSAEPSPSSKNKKEDKSNKKDLEKEKKEWIKEGFTIVKGAEKNKDSKKKAEEVKVADEAERKRKEEEKLAADERKRQLETIKKHQEMQSQAQQPPLPRQPAESVVRKAPWSASNQSLELSSRDGPTLAEIQRLEREKKLEQMKEQQQMMQLIAQQQAAALAREQDMPLGLSWAKKPAIPANSQTLTEIQAEARRQGSTIGMSTATAAAREEAQPTPPPVNNVPWANVQNGGAAGFWDTPPVEPTKPVAKPVDIVKPEPKPKKKVTVMAPPKPENTPSVEFDMWCTNMLVSWRETGIDIPTFVAFLRDIESPYEVKDYVKLYLGDTRESNDFSRQFLERRSRLLRVGTVTPSDDLCSPAVAVNPRTNSGSDYTEVKGKGKKTKKNKMLKVDARNILGFSVTASEDRINVGDIDTV